MVTIEINELTEEGKALLEVARLFSAEKQGVKIIETKESIPNSETSEVFEDTDRKRNLNNTTSHKDLLDKLNP